MAKPRPSVLGSFSEVIKGNTGHHCVTLTVRPLVGDDGLTWEGDGIAADEQHTYRNALREFHAKYPGIHVSFESLGEWENLFT